MNAWKVILATLVIFGAGVLTGGLLVSYSDRALRPTAAHPMASSSPNQPPAPIAVQNPAVQNPGSRENRFPPVLPVLLRKEFLDRLTHEITLDSAQRERIEKILAEGQERTREVSQQTIRQIRGELMPEQRARFEELMRRSREQRKPLPPRDRPTTNLPADVSPNPAR